MAKKFTFKLWRKPVGFHIRLGNAFEAGWSTNEDRDPRYKEALGDFMRRVKGGK